MAISFQPVPGDRPLRVGMIGLGSAAQVLHLPLLTSTNGIELVGLCDTEPYKLGKLADRYGVPGFLDSTNLIKSVEPDVVFICTPTISHLPLGLEALRNNVHVILEKPATRNLEEVLRLKAAAEKAQKLVQVAMNFRFRQDVEVVRNFINGGELGKIWRVRAGWLKQASAWDRSPWLDQPNITGGGVLMDLGIQFVDLLHWMFKYPDIRRVVAFAHQEGLKRNVEDTLHGVIEYEDGQTIHLDVSWGLRAERSIAYSYIEGTQGSAQLNPLSIWKHMHGELVNVAPVKPMSPGELYHTSFQAQLKHFVYALRGETTSISTIEDAAKTMQVVDLLYQSVRTGREVFLNNA